MPWQATPCEGGDQRVPGGVSHNATKCHAAFSSSESCVGVGMHALNRDGPASNRVQSAAKVQEYHIIGTR